MLSDRSTPSLSTFFQPAYAWTAILALVLITIAGIAAGAGKILNYVFPAGSFAVALYLYFRAPLLYVGFSWWITFLSPLIRRLADYRGGFTDPSPILLAPFLVFLVSGITLWQSLPQIQRQGGIPFILSLAGVIYGFFVGALLRAPIKAGQAVLNWLTPILLGLHLFIHWREYPRYRENIQQTFVWGVLVMGGYGIVQYLIAPDWDRAWMTNVDLVSIGTPEPLGIRVWSTMNSPEPFSAFMAASLLLLFTTASPLTLPAAIAGYLSFMLTLARAAWLGWFAGFLSLIGLLKPKFQFRLILSVVIMALCIVPLTMIEPFSGVVNTRLQSFTDIANDDSAQDRQATYGEIFDTALVSFLGGGVGGPSYDSTILSMLLELGWLGSIFFAGGMILLLFNLFQGPGEKTDPFVGAARAIVLTAVIRIPVNASILGVSGLVFWGFLGMGLAARQYYQAQRTLAMQSEVEFLIQRSQQKSLDTTDSANY